MLAVAACGDDGGNNNGDDTCGDGQTTGAEQCDDGNTMNGDGCSSTCRNESSGPVCGDGVMSGNEECDDSNTMDGDGCSATCMDEEKPETCGNGALDANEDCDDANTIANDGCTACNVDNGWTCNDAAPSVCTMVVTADGTCNAPFEVTLAADADGDLVGHAMGDTTTSTDQVMAAECGDVPSAGGGKDHEYKFTLAAPADVWIHGEETPAFDTLLRLSTASCSLTSVIADDQSGFACSDDNGIDFPDELYYVNLPAGTYYLTVDGSASAAEGAYDVTIIAFMTSTCGDGLLDFGEECDDDDDMGGDGCDARCDVEDGYICDTDVDPSVCEMTCGNGTFEPALEECEYIVGVNDDICTATCTLVSDVTEAEPNDTAAQAMTITEADHRIRGSLTSATDVDLYKITLTQPAFLELETYNASDEYDDNYTGIGLVPTFDCYYSANTKLAVFDAADDVTVDAMALAIDDNDGDIDCSYIGGEDLANPLEGLLEPGTYIIKVTGTAAQSRYILDVYISPAAAPVAGDLVINEVMAADGTADTNCDGDMAGETDEFVEIVNVSNKLLTINGMRVNDSMNTRHTFAPGPTGYVGMLPGESVVVWAGGAPACVNVASWFTASQGSLLLGNGGDSVTLLPAGTSTTALATMSFGSATNGFSLNLNPDLTGTAYARHDTITGHVGNFSPGKAVDGTDFILP